MMSASEPTMADCECLSRCPFFLDRMANMPALADMMKESYCQGDFLSCARYQVFKALGPAQVPADLFPNMMEEAQALLMN